VKNQPGNAPKWFSLRVLLGFAVGVFFLYLTFWKPNLSGLFHGRIGIIDAFFGTSRIQLSELAQVLKKARYIYLLPAIIMFLVSFQVRAYRWKLFLLPVAGERGIRFGVVYSAMMIGYMVNNVLPLRMGEIYRAYSLGKERKLSRSSIFATIVVERVFDILCLLLILGIILLLFPFPHWIKQSSLITFIGTVALIVLLVVMIVKTDQLVRFIRIIFGLLGKRGRGWAEKTEYITRQFAQGLQVFRPETSGKHYVMVIVTSVLLWVFYLGCVYCMFYTFDLISPMFPGIQRSPIMASLVILAVGTIAITVPSTPGAVGTYHGVVVLGLTLFGVPPEQGMGFALVMHLFNYLPLTFIGLYCFWRQNLRFADIAAEQELEPMNMSRPE